MARYRIEGLFEDAKSRESAFKEEHYNQTGLGFYRDGVYTQRHYMTIHIATMPTVTDTLGIGGATFQFLATELAASDIRENMGLVINGDMKAANGNDWAYDSTWTYDASGDKITHTAGDHVGDSYLQSASVDLASATAADPQTPATADDTSASYTVDNTTAVQQTTWKAVVGRTYTVVYTVSGRSAGTITMSIGGTAGTGRTADGTYTEALVAVTDGYLTFTPTKTFDGSITAITVTDGVTDYLIPLRDRLIEKINAYSRLDWNGVTTNATAVTAYELGDTSKILLVANVVDAEPTFSACGTHIAEDIAWTQVISDANLNSTSYFLIDNTSAKEAIPTILVERNSGTDKNFLY